MSVFTSREANKLFGGNEGDQLLSYVMRQGFGNKEYFVEGNWISRPEGKIRGSRYIFPSDFSKIQNIANIWNWIKEKSIQTPTYTDKVLQQLSDSLLMSQRLCFFSPWGPRYNNNSPIIKEYDSEIMTLRELKTILQTFREKGYTPDLLLMPADAYGTEINGLSETFVDDYFKSLEEWTHKELGETKVRVVRWSHVRDEQRELYDTLCQRVDQAFDEYINGRIYRNSIEVAKVFNPNQAKESARKYCIERIVEGEIISRVYNPINIF